MRCCSPPSQAEGNTLRVTGTDRPPVGRVVTAGDHRIAMAFAVLGRVRGARIRVDNMACAAVSFPGFADTLPVDREGTMSPRVVAIDGPAASGKSSTAAAVAKRLGFLHVDSGALYRDLTRVALDTGRPFGPERVLAQAERRGLAYRAGEGGLTIWLDDQPAESRIRAEEVTAAVSEVSAAV